MPLARQRKDQFAAQGYPGVVLLATEKSVPQGRKIPARSRKRHEAQIHSSPQRRTKTMLDLDRWQVFAQLSLSNPSPLGAPCRVLQQQRQISASLICV